MNAQVKYPSLVEQFLNEECTAYVRMQLQAWLAGKGIDRQPEPRRWEFNRFEVSLEATGDTITLEDILDPTEAGRVRLSVAEFAAALAKSEPSVP
jgi:hypothetical protein